LHTIATTDGTPAPLKSRHWQGVIAEAYFPLDLAFRDADRFGGRLEAWTFGTVSLSRLASDPLAYSRHRRHVSTDGEEHYLVTVPALSDVAFAQCGRSVRCTPGGFILERSNEPYEFSHGVRNDLWVLKVPSAALAGRIRAPDRFCTLQFDARTGVGQLFVDFLTLLPARFGTLSADARAAIGQQLVDLMALAVREDVRTLTSSLSTVRDAHLARVEAYVRQNLTNPDLDPETVSAACGISARYLHALLRGTGRTLGRWVREERLGACRAMLADPACRLTVAEIAYAWGFTDQAQFSRLFKAAYGLPPRDYRRAVGPV
jgi:AraC-like DNA-binding protein